MPLVINANVPSLQAQRSLNKAHKTLNRSFQRLSSGFKLNGAANDAAGLGVSGTLRSRIRSLQVVERNAASGLSTARTAEGGLGVIGGVITRLRELAVQGASEDLTARERGVLDTEFKALVTEVDRLAESTDVNEAPLVGGVTTGTLGLDVLAVDGATAANSTTAIPALDDAISSISTDRARQGALINRLETAIANSQTMRGNLEAANSNIRDVDIAAETSVLARGQVLLEAGLSVLSQATQVPTLSLTR